MCNRHELTALHPNETVQTSALEIQPDPEISGMIISRREKVKKPSGNQEVLDTSDPLPLHDFGPFAGVFTAIALTAAGVGIVLGIMSLIDWIRFDLYLLPLGVTW
jgi:hypothetical protein